MKSPTIKDVAREANVGVGTVSRVLNDSPLVSDATRQRVLQVIEALGYSPNLAARQLSKGVTHIIGVLSPFFTLPSFNHRLAGMQDILGATDYDLVLHSVRSPAHFRDKLDTLLRQNRADGLILLTPPTLDDAYWAVERDMPLLIFDSIQTRRVPSIVIDNVEGGRLAARYLIERGYRKIGFIGDLLDNDFGFTTTRDRFAGFRGMIQEAGLPQNDDWYRFGAVGYSSAHQSATEILTRPNRPEAIFAESDMKAFELLQVAAELRLRVPDDLAVIGFDDVDAARFMGLTTVHQPLVETGQMAAGQMLRWVTEGVRPSLEPQYIPLKVVERSTA